MGEKTKIIVGISGASGAILGIELLKALQSLPSIETHLIISSLAEKTIPYETDYSVAEVKKLCDVFYANQDLGAAIASGSFEITGMIIVPCSMKTLGGLASGYAENLLLRAADVCMKERRKLVIVPRETPLNGIHLRNLSFLHDQGVIVLPAMMTFYHRPQSIEEMTNQLIGKILRQFNLPFENYKTWQGMGETDE